MRKKRDLPIRKSSFLHRFWQWLLRLAKTEDGDPEPPAPLPPKMPAWQPQGQLYRMLDNRQLLAGNGGAGKKLEIYDYCGVVFYKTDQVYHYLNPGLDIQVGDRVLVPVHIHGESQNAEGLVVSSGQYLSHCVPYPLAQTSIILRKLP